MKLWREKIKQALNRRLYPVHYACKNFSAEKLELVFSGKILFNLNRIDLYGFQTAHYLAIRDDINNEILEIAMGSGMTFHRGNILISSPVSYAVSFGNINFVRFSIKKGVATSEEVAAEFNSLDHNKDYLDIEYLNFKSIKNRRLELHDWLYTEGYIQYLHVSRT